jgi:hypothetical protein
MGVETLIVRGDGCNSKQFIAGASPAAKPSEESMQSAGN